MLIEEIFTLKISILPADSFNPLHKIFKINTAGSRNLRTVPTFRVHTKRKSATNMDIAMPQSGTGNHRNTKTSFSSRQVNLFRTIHIPNSRYI